MITVNALTFYDSEAINISDVMCILDNNVPKNTTVDFVVNSEDDSISMTYTPTSDGSVSKYNPTVHVVSIDDLHRRNYHVSTIDIQKLNNRIEDLILLLDEFYDELEYNFITAFIKDDETITFNIYSENKSYE